MESTTSRSNAQSRTEWPRRAAWLARAVPQAPAPTTAMDLIPGEPWPPPSARQAGQDAQLLLVEQDQVLLFLRDELALLEVLEQAHRGLDGEAR